MKIIILHGDDEIKSYERLMKFVETAKNRSWEVIYLDEGKMSLSETLSTSSLFPGERFFVLKDIKKLGKKEVEWLNRKSKNLTGNLIIHHQGTVLDTLIKSLPEPVKVEEFKLPKLIFEFLDSIAPKNEKKSLTLLHQIVTSEPEEFVFSLLSRHLRDLYWAKVDENSLPYPSWRIGKLKKQAGNFSVGKLEEIIDSLANIDVEVKTSKSEIVPSLDLLIATKLE